MSLLDNFRKCVSRRQGLQRRLTKVLFNVKICDSFKTPDIPTQLKELLVYIAQHGVAVVDLFRRPGSSHHIKRIIADLENGRPIDWTDYSFYTLANIAKRYLLHIEGGIFGPEAEARMISLLDSQDDQARIEAMHSVIASQPKAVQQILALLFGIWFRMIYHTEVNAMSVEAVAKSVAGSVFPNSTTSPERVELASKVMEYLITGFASADLFSRDLIEYFTTETQTSISRVEKFKYEFQFPKEVPRDVSARLFAQFLEEESEKHGFDLARDAVSRETFENAQWNTVCFLEQSNGKLSNGSDNHFLLDTQHHASDGDHTMNRSLAPVTPKGQMLSTESDTPFITQSPARDAANDPVQQMSEKHTCVTATPLRNELRLFHAHEGDLPRSGANVLLSHIPEESLTEQLYRPSPRQIASFNSVKRRQLERLQKRSDWFLSPPAGLRGTGKLMHLDPSTPKSTPLKQSDPWHESQPRLREPNQTGLVSAIPNSVSSTAPLGIPDSQLKSNLSISVPAAASSPKHVPPSINTPVLASTENKENFPEVEVRYFVVKRYYGPDRSSSPSRVDCLSARLFS